MKRIRQVCLLMAPAFVLAVQPAKARTSPVIVGEQDNPRCLAALSMATDVFRSPHVSLVWPVVQPDSDYATVVLSRVAEDVSGGDALLVDPAVFERIELGRPSQRIFWQRGSSDGRRLVAVNEPHGWRGEEYYLFSVSEELAREEFMDIITRTDGLPPESLMEDAPGVLLGEGGWNPPVVLLERSSGELSVIDNPNPAMAAWRIFETRSGEVTSPCQIDFTPDGEPGLRRLPLAVRQFAVLADEALGPGLDEGTLQPTATIRGKIAQHWQLVSHRPWALTDHPYNSRAEVDAGLLLWSRESAARARLYRSLQHSYSAAESALEDYYAAQFGAPADVARRFSAYAMDHMLRAHFVFPSESAYLNRADRDAIQPTPWPADLR